MTLKSTLKMALHLTFQPKQPKDKIILHHILAKPWQIVGVDMFTLKINTTFTFYLQYYLCIVDYHSKFPVIKKSEDLSADSLILTCKVIFTEYWLPKKIMSGSGSKFILDKFKMFCKSLNIGQAFLSSYHHQSNRQVEACIKFIKCTLKNVLIWNVIHI